VVTDHEHLHSVATFPRLLGRNPHGPQPRRVTIVDVAQHAQVSTTAVSKVLRNAYGTSPTMRAKVQAAIAELGYRPHAGARAMRGQTYTIGVLVPDLRNPFFPDILDGLADHLRDHRLPGFSGTQSLQGRAGRGEGHRGDDRPGHGRPGPDRADLARAP
jgi:hypothetical protein